MENQNNVKSAQRNSKNKKKKPKYKSLNIKNWGIDYMKNEYKEIVLSNSNHPEWLR